MLNNYLSSQICKRELLTIIFQDKFFQIVWIPLTRPDQPGTFLLSLLAILISVFLPEKDPGQ